ncbi:MAG: thiamine diphosphokinase [Clostridia bacterium]|nr:thiamine diphosphokinase [Clostridia bacterium]
MSNGEKICYIACALDCDIDISLNEGDFVIGADKGYQILESNGIKPNLALGDFDSYDGKINAENVIRFPVKKDFTDSELAIMHAIELGYKKIQVFGAIGAYLDHTLANVTILSKYTEKGIDLSFIDGEKLLFAISNSQVDFTSEAKGRISIFSAKDKSYGVFEKGLLYELDNATLEANTPLGVSNEFIGKDATISVKNGTLIIYTDRKNYENYLTRR